jgi:hypothetical protein
MIHAKRIGTYRKEPARAVKISECFTKHLVGFTADLFPPF